jgi:Ala-tRNA(Pro) deacylase
MAYHPLAERITGLLRERGFSFERFEHDPVRTSEEAAKLRPEYTLHQGAKALIVNAKLEGAKRFVMLVVPGDMKFDRDKVKALGLREVRFATEEEISKITDGVQIGGIPPFGNLFGLAVYADPAVLANDKIIFNAGDRSVSIGMHSKDWQTLVVPVVAPLT